ncbi:4-hydroxybenzoyl-CoA reductase subunit beta [bacterium BMS3Abin02]|nr:4-hydroxybenzoyl-CoA reductase subunit beta [bacterium BMS3Abin02]
MMRLPKFALTSPETVEDATRLLAELGDRAVVLSGGTDLLPNLKRHQLSVETVISLDRLDGLAGIRIEDGKVRIGARTTLHEIASSDLTPPVVARAAAEVASPSIRNQGTIGGNLCVDTRCFWLNVPDLWRQAAKPCLKTGGDTCWVAPAKQVCWAVSSSDLAPVMVAVGASVTLVGPDGERHVAVDELYREDGMAHLAKAPEEILTEITIPFDTDLLATYHKLRRRGTVDFPILGVAAAIRLDHGGTCTAARIVLGAVASAPLRVPDAEEALVGRPFGPGPIAEAAEAARKLARPLHNTDLTSRYRKRMVPVFVRRALEELTEHSSSCVSNPRRQATTHARTDRGEADS